MKNKRIKFIGVAILGFALMVLATPNARTAITVTIRASVLTQVCQGGDGVNVTLTATLNPPKSGVN